MLKEESSDEKMSLRRSLRLRDVSKTSTQLIKTTSTLKKRLSLQNGVLQTLSTSKGINGGLSNNNIEIDQESDAEEHLEDNERKKGLSEGTTNSKNENNQVEEKVVKDAKTQVSEIHVEEENKENQEKNNCNNLVNSKSDCTKSESEDRNRILANCEKNDSNIVSSSPISNCEGNLQENKETNDKIEANNDCSNSLITTKDCNEEHERNVEKERDQNDSIIIENLSKKLKDAIRTRGCNNVVKKLKAQISKALNNEDTVETTRDVVNNKENRMEKELDEKIDNLLLNTSVTSSSDEESNSFIYTQAEEGEEDTPSEDSNDIIEVGEEIHTDSERSTDDSYDRDSFIDDEGEHKLLSGEEFDLSLNSPKKYGRIRELSSGSDDEIVHIKRSKKKPQKKRKKSRIIKFEDSSDEENNEILNEDNNCKERENNEVLRESQKNNEITEEKEDTECIEDEQMEEKQDTEEIKIDDHDCKKIVVLENIVVKEVPIEKQFNSIKLLSEISDENADLKKIANTHKKKRRRRRKKNFRKLDDSCQNKEEINELKDEPSVSNNLSVTKVEEVKLTSGKHTDLCDTGKKRKRSTSDIETSCASGQNFVKRRKKNKNKDKKILGESLVDEAIVNNVKTSMLNRNLWNVEDVLLKPSRPGIKKVTNKEKTQIKDKKKLQSTEKINFHPKDFRNFMLYDPSRNKRINTKCLLKKKIYNFTFSFD